MSQGILIDRDALHRILWRRAGRGGTLRMKWGELSAELGISFYTMSRLLDEFEENGRIRRMRGAGPRAKRHMIIVTDPAVWSAEAS